MRCLSTPMICSSRSSGSFSVVSTLKIMLCPPRRSMPSFRPFVDKDHTHTITSKATMANFSGRFFAFIVIPIVQCSAFVKLLLPVRSGRHGPDAHVCRWVASFFSASHKLHSRRVLRCRPPGAE